MGVPVIYAVLLVVGFVVGVACGIDFEERASRDRTREALDALARTYERAQREAEFARRFDLPVQGVE